MAIEGHPPTTDHRALGAILRLQDTDETLHLGGMEAALVQEIEISTHIAHDLIHDRCHRGERDHGLTLQDRGVDPLPEEVEERIAAGIVRLHHQEEEGVEAGGARAIRVILATVIGAAVEAGIGTEGDANVQREALVTKEVP